MGDKLRLFGTLRDAGAIDAPEGEGGGGHTIQDEGTPFTQRTALDFAGAGVAATDDPTNDRTIITIPGGGGAAPQIARVVRASGDYTRESGVWGDIDTANLVINMTTAASWVWLLLAGTTGGLGSYEKLCFDFTIDGTRQGQVCGVQSLVAFGEQELQIVWLAQVAAGAHVFRPQWRCEYEAFARIRASAATTPLLFTVAELK